MASAGPNDEGGQAKPRLFHVSDDAGISRFDPRPVPSPDTGVEGEAVWAIAESHLPNYLLPRDCPRICFRPRRDTTQADRDRFLLGASHVVAFEASWLARVRACELTIYALPVETFEEVVPDAAYWVSRTPVAPMSSAPIGDILSALTDSGTEVRVLQDFWSLRDAVVASSLQFSIIRSRNARPRA